VKKNIGIVSALSCDEIKFSLILCYC